MTPGDNDPLGILAPAKPKQSGDPLGILKEKKNPSGQDSGSTLPPLGDGIPTAQDLGTSKERDYSFVTDPALRHRLKENDAHYATIKMAQQMKQSKGSPPPKDPLTQKPVERGLLDQISQAMYLPAFNEGFNDLVIKPYAGAADFFSRTIDKAYRGITGNDAPEWLVGNKDHNDALHNLVKQYDEEYNNRDKPTNLASDIAEGTVGSMPLVAALFTGEGEASLATKLPNLFTKTAKLMGTTGALNAYEDATKAKKSDTESLKEAVKGGAEGVKKGLELDAQMLVGGALGKEVVGKLAEKGVLKGGKVGVALIHAIATGTVFAGTSAGNDLLEGKDIDTREAMKQMGMGLAFESIPVAKALHDEIVNRSDAKKINEEAAKTGVATAAASNMNAESMMRTLMNTPTERLQTINDNIDANHEDLYAQSLEYGMKAYDSEDLNEKRTHYGNQLLLKTQGDVKNIASKLGDHAVRAELIDDISNSDELTDDHKKELIDKINVLTPKPNDNINVEQAAPADVQADEKKDIPEKTDEEVKPVVKDEPKEKVPETPKAQTEGEQIEPEKPIEQAKEPAEEPIKESGDQKEVKIPEKVEEKSVETQETKKTEGDQPESKSKGKVIDNNLLQPSKLKGTKYNLVLAQNADGKYGIVDKNSGTIVSSLYDDVVDARLAYSKAREKLTPKMIDDAISHKTEAKSASVMALPFMNEFIEHDVKPAVQKLATNTKEALGSIVRTLSPKTGVSLKAMDDVANHLNSRNEAATAMDKAVGSIEKMFDKMPDAQRIDFIDRIKRGQKQETPELQDIADMYSKLDKNLYDEISAIKGSLPFKENHFRVLWKELPGSEKPRNWFGVARRPLEGSKGFLKKATLIDMSEGIARGGVPLSTNPMTMFKAAYGDAMKFITAHRMFDALKKDDFVKFVKIGGEVPEGYTKIDDKIANVYFPVKEGLVKAGEWYIEKNVGRIVNNHLSRDYIRESPIGRGLMNLKNLYTAAELGLSGYHASAIALEGVSSDIGRGFRKLVNLGTRGDFKAAGEGIMDILKAPFSPKTTFSLGRNTIKLATEKDFESSDFGKKFLAANPQAKQYIHDLFMGGGLMKQSADLKANTYKAMKEAAGKDNYIGAALRAIPALNEMVMSPLFDHYIPAMKVGMFMKEFPLSLKENESRIASGKTTREEVARKTVNFIDDRLGEMNFDNLYWNRTFKTASQLMLRSVTWKLGNIRAMGGAFPEQAMEFYNAAKENRAPNLSPKMAWVFGLATMQVALAGVTQYLFTGNYPQTIKDLIAPKVNKDNDKERMVLPTYIKDLTHLYYKGAPDYVASSLSGDVTKLHDVWNNADFQKYQIYSPHDDLAQQAKDITGYVLPKPISISALQKSIKDEDSYGQMAMSFFGLNKAPKYLTNPPIENKIFDLYNIHQGIKSKGQKDIRDLKQQILTLYKQKKYDEAEKVASDAIEKGEITQRQFSYLNKNMGKSDTPAHFFFNELPIDDKVALYKEMTDKEREEYDPKGKVAQEVEIQRLYEEKQKKKDKPYSSFK